MLLTVYCSRFTVPEAWMRPSVNCQPSTVHCEHHV
jgi:hypothetical protein